MNAKRIPYIHQIYSVNEEDDYKIIEKKPVIIKTKKQLRKYMIDYYFKQQGKELLAFKLTGSPNKNLIVVSPRVNMFGNPTVCFKSVAK